MASLVALRPVVRSAPTGAVRTPVTKIALIPAPAPTKVNVAPLLAKVSIAPLPSAVSLSSAPSSASSSLSGGWFGGDDSDGLATLSASSSGSPSSSALTPQSLTLAPFGQPTASQASSVSNTPAAASAIQPWMYYAGAGAVALLVIGGVVLLSQPKRGRR